MSGCRLQPEDPLAIDAAEFALAKTGLVHDKLPLPHQFGVVVAAMEGEIIHDGQLPEKRDLRKV